MASPCIIKYNGKEYSYEQFASMMHDGLLRDLINRDVIDNSDFVGTMEVFEPEVDKAEKMNRIIDSIKKAFPNVEVIIDDTLKGVAGKVDKQGRIYINPDYAGFDTPIHEAGHILIDAIGYENKVIQQAVKQLRGTPLYKETKERYKELSEEELDKEVLAEAIGREGEGIFDTEVEKSKFKKYLDYIFDWLKTKLGMNKNIAKSLAKQVIGGIGTKGIVTAKGKVVQFQMPSGERVNGVEIMPEVVDGFYSKLEKQLLQMKVDKMPAKQWNDKLRGEESKWTGLIDWLTEKGQTSVTKQEIKDFLKDNRIQIVEVVKGGSETELLDRVEKAEEKFGVNVNIDENPMDGSPDIQISGEKLEDMTDDEIQELQDEVYDFVMAAAPETKFSAYQLEGEKENYKEILVTMPRKGASYSELAKKLSDKYGIDKNVSAIRFLKEVEDRATKQEYNQLLERKKDVSSFRSTHFDEPNILVHLRMNERTDENGNKVLFLEEVQSDWGQEGKKAGFIKNKSEIEKEFLNQGYSTKKEGDFYTAIYDKNGNRIGDVRNEDLFDGKERVITGGISKGTVSAPFVTDTNAWVKLGLKYALRQAVESGASKIAWTTGKQQNARYDLSKQISKVSYNKETETLFITDKKTNRIETRNVPKDKLAENIGKDLSEKILNDPAYFTTYEGVDLEMGGKGMIGFYDKILPDVFRALTKELTGSSMELGSVNIGEGNQMSIDITPELAQSVSKGMSQFQKEKEEEDKPKPKKPKKPQILGMDLYRDVILKRDVEQEAKDLAKIEELLEREDLDADTIESLKKTKRNIEYVRKLDSKKYRGYRASRQRLSEIRASENLNDYNENELVEILNDIEGLDNDAKEAFGNEVKVKIALYLDRKGKDRISAEHKDYIEGVANKKDISSTSVGMMVLSQADQNQPALQELSKVFDSAHLDKVIETNDKQSENEQLAREVIKEKNKQLGIVEKTKDFLFADDNAKYFEYMINPKAIELETGKYLPGYWTIEQGRAKGFSKAQLNYLQFHRNLIEERSKQILGNQYYETASPDMEIIQTDKKFKEAYRTEGVINAFSYYLGGGKNSLGRVRIEYTDPVTKKESIDYFANIEKKIANYGKKGILEKGKALALILRYNFKARRQLKSGMNADEKANPLDIKGTGEYSINGRGALVSKFDKPRSSERGYSTDMFRAANEFIAENAHTKHMSKILVMARAVQKLAQLGYMQEGIKQKPNVEKYLEEWINMHLFNQIREGDPIVDATLRKLRGLVSMSTMAFAVTAQTLNAGFGIYNNWRAENKETLAKGYKRLFGGKKEFSKEGDYGIFNPYAMAIVRKYNIASIDSDSNPNMGLGEFFQKLANWGTKWGEIQTQSSLALGLMSEEDYNSFEFVTKPNGTKVLEVKKKDSKGNPINEQALKDRIISHTNTVSDIQGKYNEKDRINLMNSEFYKAVFQFKVWMPSWWKVRFGENYINRDSKKITSTWSVLKPKAFKELRRQIRKDGWKKGLYDGNTPEAKAAMANLKGLMVMGLVLVLKYSDDEDDRKRKEAMLADKLMGNLLFVFDPSSAKYLLQNPVPAVGVVVKYIDAVEKLSKFEDKETKKAFKEIGSTLPYKKLEDAYDIITEE
jgi:hypothetical protein